MSRRGPANKRMCRCHRRKTALGRKKSRRPRASRSDSGRKVARLPSGSNARASRPSASRWCRMSIANMRPRPHRSARPRQAHVRRQAALRTVATFQDHHRPRRSAAMSVQKRRPAVRREEARWKRMPSWRESRQQVSILVFREQRVEQHGNDPARMAPQNRIGNSIESCSMMAMRFSRSTPNRANAGPTRATASYNCA